MRIVFYGTPEFAVASLEALLDTHHEVVAVVTAPDKLGGRGGQQVQSSDVKRFAERHQLLVHQPKSLKSKAFAKTLTALAPDLQVVVAFRMMPESIWSLPPLGTVNVHGSLLPAYRGAAPIHWAVINGERETGVSVFFLQHAIDTGNLLLQARTEIAPTETTGEVYGRLMQLGADTLVEALDLIAAGQTEGRPQDDSLATHAPKLTRDNTRIDWSRPADKVYNFVRGLHPYPTAWTTFEGQEVKVLRSARLDAAHIGYDAMAATAGQLVPLSRDETSISEGPGLAIATGGGQVLELLELKPAGKRAMSGLDFRNGLRGDGVFRFD